MPKLIQYQTEASKFDGPWKWQAAGMGYLVKTTGGKLIMIDGGHEVDAEKVISMLERESEGKPRVSLWILTHPHGDHIACLTEIALREELRSRVDIDCVMAAYPEEFKPANGKSYLREHSRMKKIREGIDASFISPRADMELSLDDVRLRVLATYHTMPEPKNINDLSTVFILEGKKHRVMFTGDATERTVDGLIEKYGAVLRCDICQVSHHALDGASVEFYRAVGAKTLLVPMSKSGHDAMKGPKYARVTEPARVAIREARKVIYSFNGEAVLEI